MPRGRDVDIQENKLKVLKRWENEKGGGYELKITAWIVDGREKPPTIVHQPFWITEDGSSRNGKTQGLTVQDLYVILENISEVAQIMKLPANKLEEVLKNVLGPAGPVSEKAF